ncbi:MAG: hypothetical protein NUV77_07025 [Thermoguttaceae bacterium]|jgi:hypothetical protein|nr:hypothetical protein [Thermoguttaceae bacterium]
MRCTRGLICLVVLGCGSSLSLARESEGARENSILLNGRWEFAVGSGNEGAETPAGQRGLSWRPVALPGPFMKWSQEALHQTKVVWARRSFRISAAQAEAMAVLRWNRIANGAAAFLNGRKVGENEPTGPFQVIVPAGVLRPGENQIVLKILGAPSVRRSKSGNPLIPAGFGVGIPQVTEDVWIDFADRAYMKWVLAMPDLAGRRVRIRVTPTGVQRLDALTIAAQVKPWPDGEVLGKGQATARLVPDPDPLGGEHFVVDVPMPDFEPWTHETCPLYVAQVTLAKAGRVLDKMSFRFGMREIGVKNRHYQLNGKNLWLRGSNLVFEWNWGDIVLGKEKDYLVVEAREMSMNSFRTHTQPPPRHWCDVCDEHGTMILAEFPVLFNYQDYKFTPDEWDVWHRNGLADAAGWMTRLWNHPSVIMWVLSNESRGDNAWEEGPFQDFVRAMDPTRPTMRTGSTGTRENYDVHPCGNITETDEGFLFPQIPSWFEAAGQRTTTVSEYMNDFGHPRTQWAGVDDRLAHDLAVAQIGAEHTEAMRRARVDAILPYMYAGWTRTRQAARVRETGKGSAVWKAGYASPLSACWHSSLSPVLASLDLFDPNYLTGQEVTTQLHLINDSWRDAQVHVDLLLTKECPEFIPEAACFDHPVSRWSFDFSLKADSIEKVPVTWRLPEEEGCYWLTARTTGLPGRAVLSQRFVRATRPAVVPDALRRVVFVVLGASDAARAFFRSKGLRTSDRVDDLSPESHVVVVWNATHLTQAERRHGSTLRAFADRGGRVLVLATPSWEWRELCDVRITRQPRFSRVFPSRDLKDSLLAGMDPQYLIRWNGLPGTVAYGTIEGDMMDRAEKILWAREPKTTVMASVPTASGRGRIVFSQLDLQGRVDRNRPQYDPVAERVLLRLLDAETP